MRNFHEVWDLLEAGKYSKEQKAIMEAGWNLAMGEVAIDNAKVMKEFDYFKVQKVALEMRQSGGSFMQALGKAFTVADQTNASKLYCAFAKDFAEFYLRAMDRANYDLLLANMTSMFKP